MTDLRIDEASQESQEALKARLASSRWGAALARPQIIAVAFIESLLSGTDLALDTPEGMDALRGGWPDIVDAVLFRRAREPAKKKGRSKAGKRPKAGPACGKSGMCDHESLLSFGAFWG